MTIESNGWNKTSLCILDPEKEESISLVDGDYHVLVVNSVGYMEVLVWITAEDQQWLNANLNPVDWDEYAGWLPIPSAPRQWQDELAEHEEFAYRKLAEAKFRGTMTDDQKYYTPIECANLCRYSNSSGFLRAFRAAGFKTLGQPRGKTLVKVEDVEAFLQGGGGGGGSRPMTWTQFWDMHSGGGLKEEPYNMIYIEAPEDVAKTIFFNKFGHNPERVSCTCCGDDYGIYEVDAPKSQYDKTALIVPEADITDAMREGGPPPEVGYVWVGD